MKVIFLDIDGVLNSEKYYKEVDRSNKNWSRFDPQVVKLLIKLIDEFALKIVMSSTWRFGAKQQLKKELIKSGLFKYLHKDWATPQMYPPNRGTEIKCWLEEHPDTKDFLIIDDDENILYEHRSRFVKTDLLSEMQEDHYVQARKILIYPNSN